MPAEFRARRAAVQGNLKITMEPRCKERAADCHGVGRKPGDGRPWHQCVTSASTTHSLRSGFRLFLWLAGVPSLRDSTPAYALTSLRDSKFRNWRCEIISAFAELISPAASGMKNTSVEELPRCAKCLSCAWGISAWPCCDGGSAPAGRRTSGGSACNRGGRRASPCSGGRNPIR